MGGSTSAIYDDARSAWGAAPNRAGSGTYVKPSSRLGISWHYDGGTALGLAGKPHTACLSFVLGIQRTHFANGWQDIGYNLLVCPHGRAIEGRGVDLVGAHSPGVNVVHYGVQTLTGGSEPLTTAQITRMRVLARDLEAHSGHALRQWGHRDDTQASTECPGDYIEGLVKSGTFAPSATTVPEEDDMFSDADRATLNGVNTLLARLDELKGQESNRYADYVRRFNSLQAAIDPSALADAVLAKLPADADITREDVKAALGEALAESVKVTGNLTVEPNPPAA